MVLLKFDDHHKRGVYYRSPLNWTNTMNMAIDLAQNHSKNTGVRSLDIIHVASALAIKADRFLTLDERQAKLAASAGLSLEDCTKPPLAQT
jgi:predicted nucleic acid-binding protein